MTEENDRNPEAPEGVPNMASVGPTADAGTSDDANWIGTTDNVRPGDVYATGGSGDAPGTIGDAIGPLATPTGTTGGYGSYAQPRNDDGIGANEGGLTPGPVTGGTPIGSEGYGAPENAGPGRMPPIGANLAQTGIGGITGPGGATSSSGSEGAPGANADNTGSPAAQGGTITGRAAGASGTQAFQGVGDQTQAQGIEGLPTGLGPGPNTGSSAEIGPEGGAHAEPGTEPLA